MVSPIMKKQNTASRVTGLTALSRQTGKKAYIPKINRVGSSNNCLTRTKKPTDSRPSMIR